MNILIAEIKRLQSELKDSEDKLQYYTKSDKTRETYRNAHIRWQLRKLSKLVDNIHLFCCSQCGELFKHRKQRDMHSKQHMKL